MTEENLRDIHVYIIFSIAVVTEEIMQLRFCIFSIMKMKRFIKKIGSVAFIFLVVGWESPSSTAGPFGKCGASVRYADGERVVLVCMYHLFRCECWRGDNDKM
jgi:hypothetical protein